VLPSPYVLVVIILGFGITFKLLYDLSSKIEEGLEDLDHNLAIAIKSVVDNIPGLGENAEPINPVQQMLAQLIGQHMQSKQVIIPPKVIQQDDKGLFIKND